MNELLEQVLKALVKYVVNSEEFKKAISAQMVPADEEQIKDVIGEYISSEGTFETRVKEIVEACDTESTRFKDKVKAVVSDMTFTTEVSRW